MKIKKSNATSSNRSCIGSWLAHWEKLSGQNAYMCFGQGCINTPSVGVLIQKDSLTDQNLYVIPLCDECNKKMGQELDIWDTATLVFADAIETKGMATVTPRIFAQWASERLPDGRVFSRARVQKY